MAMLFPISPALGSGVLLDSSDSLHLHTFKLSTSHLDFVIRAVGPVNWWLMIKMKQNADSVEFSRLLIDTSV